MLQEMRPGAKIALGIIAFGALFGVITLVQHFMPAGSEAVEITDGKKLGTFKEDEASAASAVTVPLPSDTPFVGGVEVRTMELPWNAQIGQMFAIGGVSTTEGSLMAKHGVQMKVEVNDMYDQMQAALVACATEMASAGSDECGNGVHFVTIMSDGGAAFMAGLNAQLAKLGPLYQAEIIGGFGRSNGEDKFMGPAVCKDTPEACRGKLFAGVPRDGDWNLGQEWIIQNQLCNNPDKTTYMPECINWVETGSFAEADQFYIGGHCEDRPIVNRKGVRIGGEKHICVEGTVTWTPGDVNVATNKGGVVTLLSTREMSGQMGNAIVGIKAWDVKHKDTVVGMLTAGLEGGTAVLTSTPALMKGGEVSAAVYGKEDGRWWVKYYRGVEEMDATGNMIKLGGSRAWTIDDAMRFYGLTPGQPNAFAASYTHFGDIAVKNYPDLLPSYPPVGEVFNGAYLKLAKEAMTAGGDTALVAVAAADVPNFDAPSENSAFIGRANWDIQFNVNEASFTPAATATLGELFNQLVVAENTRVAISGHTDSQGDDDSNLALSRARAEAVTTFLVGRGINPKRLTARGEGENKPIASNDNAKGRAANRRVEIVISSNNDDSSN